MIGLLAALAGFAIACILNLAVPHAFAIPMEGPESRKLEVGEVITEAELNVRVRAAEANRAAATQRVHEMGLGGLFLFGVAWYFAFGGPAAVVAFGLSKKCQSLSDVLLLALPCLLLVLLWSRELLGIFLLALATVIVLASKHLASRRIDGAA